MNQNDQNDDYNIVIDTLQKKLDALQEMQRGCDNLNSSFGGGIGMMDSIRYEQIDELTKAIKREQSIATEPVPDVYKAWEEGHRTGIAEQTLKMREALEEIANSVEEVGWYQEIAEKALAAKPDHIPDATKMVEQELADAHRTLAKWLNEEIDAPIDRYALAKVLTATQCLAVKECVSDQPKKLVRLTEEEVHDLIKDQLGKSVDGNNLLPFTYADAVMCAMERKNGGVA